MKFVLFEDEDVIVKDTDEEEVNDIETVSEENDDETAFEDDEEKVVDNTQEVIDEGPFMTNFDKRNGTYDVAKKVASKIRKVESKFNAKGKAKIVVKEISKEEFAKLIGKRTALSFGISVASLGLGLAGSAAAGKVSPALGYLGKQEVKHSAKKLPIDTAISGASSTAWAAIRKKKYFEIDITLNGKKQAVVLVRSKYGKQPIIDALKPQNLKPYLESLILFEKYDNLQSL